MKPVQTLHQKKPLAPNRPCHFFVFFCFFFLEHGTRCPFLCLRVCVCRFLFLLFFNFALFYFVLWPFRPRWTGGSPLGPTLKRDFVIDAIYGHRWHRRVLPFIRTRVGRVAESRVFCFVLFGCCFFYRVVARRPSTLSETTQYRLRTGFYLVVVLMRRWSSHAKPSSSPQNPVKPRRT